MSEAARQRINSAVERLAKKHGRPAHESRITGKMPVLRWESRARCPCHAGSESSMTTSNPAAAGRMPRSPGAKGASEPAAPLRVGDDRMLLAYCAGDKKVGGLNRLKVCSVPVRAFEETPHGVTTNGMP